jgi:3-oxoacyl-[acyl-carrier-protein] synthase-3
VPDFVDKMEASSGIKTRWYAPRDWCTSDLAVLGAQEALKSAGIKPEDLDLIILGTDTPDYITPSTSVVVQYKLGAKNAGTFDVSCACAGFPTGLSVAAGLIATNPAYKYILVIGAYMMSKLAAQDDPMLFFYGDGAGAAVLTGDSQPGFISSAFLADGSFHQFWGIYSGATYEPATVESVQAGRTNVRFLQRYPPEVNVVGWEKLMRSLAERGPFDLQDINLAIFTQVRLPTIEEVMGLLGLPMTKTHFFGYRYPEATKSVIAISAVSQVDPLLRGIIEGWKITVAMRDGEKFFWLTHTDNFSEGWIARNWDFLQASIPRYQALDFDAALCLLDSFLGLNITGELHRIKAPTLIVCGEKDALKPRKYAEMIGREIPQAEFVLIPDSGHAVMWEKPEVLNSVILGFLMKESKS